MITHLSTEILILYWEILSFRWSFLLLHNIFIQNL